VRNCKFLIAMWGLWLVAIASSVRASVFVSEPFNYTSGTDLNTQSPDGGIHTWGSAGSGQTEEVVSGTLAIPSGFPPNPGAMVTYGGIGETDRINLDPADASFSTGSLFYSFSLQINNLGSLPTLSADNQIIAGFNNLTGSQTSDISVLGGPLWVSPAGGTSTTSYELGVSTSSSNTTRIYGSATYATGDTLFVVVARNFNSGVSTANAQLWVYDLTNGDVVPAGLPATDNATSLAGGGSITSLASFALYQPGTGVTNYLGTDGINVADLRLGTTWADVVPVPEPVGTTLLAPGVIMLVRRRRSGLNCERESSGK
jgi:hypothetical protein